MVNPEVVKQIFDVAGYVFTGACGVIGAWQKLRTTLHPPTGSKPAPKTGMKHNSTAIERLRRVEHDLIDLRRRQDEMHMENVVQQSSMLKQQTAMFDLLVEQRSSIDKILTKMKGSD